MNEVIISMLVCKYINNNPICAEIKDVGVYDYSRAASYDAFHYALDEILSVSHLKDNITVTMNMHRVLDKNVYSATIRVEHSYVSTEVIPVILDMDGNEISIEMSKEVFRGTARQCAMKFRHTDDVKHIDDEEIYRMMRNCKSSTHSYYNGGYRNKAIDLAVKVVRYHSVSALAELVSMEYELELPSKERRIETETIGLDDIDFGEYFLSQFDDGNETHTSVNMIWTQDQEDNYQKMMHHTFDYIYTRAKNTSRIQSDHDEVIAQYDKAVDEFIRRKEGR